MKKIIEFIKQRWIFYLILSILIGINFWVWIPPIKMFLGINIESWKIILPNLIAILAVLVGPIISIMLTNKQITAQFNSTNLEKWNERFYSSLKDYLTATKSSVAHSELIKMKDKLSQIQLDNALNNYREYIRTQQFNYTSLKLILNLNEAKQIQFWNLLTEYNLLIMSYCSGTKDINYDIFEEMGNNLLILGNSIFNRNWELIMSNKDYFSNTKT